MKHNLDFVDRKIIAILQQNARTTLKEMASKVYLSSPATSARIEKLENMGYIAGYHANVDKERLGYKLKAFINVEVENSRKEEFLSLAKNCPCVVECNCITGEYAMLLQVAFPNTEELEDFVSKIQEFGKTQTQMVFSTPVEHREILCPMG